MQQQQWWYHIQMSFVTVFNIHTPAILSYTSSWIHWNSEKLILSVSCVWLLCCGFSHPKPVFLTWGQKLSWAHKENSTQHLATASSPRHYLESVPGQNCPPGSGLQHQELHKGRGRGWFQLLSVWELITLLGRQPCGVLSELTPHGAHRDNCILVLCLTMPCLLAPSYY